MADPRILKYEEAAVKVAKTFNSRQELGDYVKSTFPEFYAKHKDAIDWQAEADRWRGNMSVAPNEVVSRVGAWEAWAVEKLQKGEDLNV